MSSRIRRIKHGEAALLLASMLAMTVWYAWPQLIYTFYIVYDIIRTFFPEFLLYLDPIAH